MNSKKNTHRAKISKDRKKSYQKLILAISGGPDSVYLFHTFLKIPAKNRPKLIIAHFNHGLRGGASDLDQQFVKKLAIENSLQFESAKTDVKKYATAHKMNLEEAARILRYDFLEEIRGKYQAEYVVTAHHRDDNIETILLNFFRGSSFRGLSGMKEKTILRFKKPTEDREQLSLNEINLSNKNFSVTIWRPLLDRKKAEILAYLKKNRIAFRKDASNNDLSFRRNFMRKKILPLLKKFNPEIGNTIINNAALFAEAEDYIEGEFSQWLKKFRNNDQLKFLQLKNSSKKKAILEFPHLKKFASKASIFEFSLNSFQKLHPFMQKTVLHQLYQNFAPEKQLSKEHLEQLLKIIKEGKSGTQKEFGTMHFLRIGRQKIEIS